MVSTCWAHYKLNEASGNALDACTNSRNLTETGTVPSQTGKISNARGAYSSSSNYFSRNTTGEGINSASSFSFCVWIKCITAPTSDEGIFAWGNAATAGEFYGYLDCKQGTSANVRMLIAKLPATYSIATASVTWSDNTWYHIIGTWNTTTGDILIYVNNVVCDAPAQVTIDSTTDATILTLGNRTQLDYPVTSFYTDDFRIYNQLLTSSERAFIYNSGSGTENELVAKFRHFGKFWWKK